MLIADRYETVELLGAGGMGEVFLARDRTGGPDVAVKLLKEAVSEDIVVRFDRECELLSRMSHPAVVRVLDRGESEGRVFYAMEYIPWPTLAQLISERYRDGRGISVDEALAILGGIAGALDHLHSLDVVHRDLKPSNLLVSEELQVRVIDFGLAGMLYDRMTRTGALLGSMLYLSPEQVRADKSLDKRSDVFQLGLILYEMLTGKRAYKDIVGYVGKLRSGEGPFAPPHEISPAVPEPVSRAVMRALALDPEDRPSTAGELHTLLASAAREAGAAPQQASPRRSRPAASAAKPRGSRPAARPVRPAPDSPVQLNPGRKLVPSLVGLGLALAAGVFAGVYFSFGLGAPPAVEGVEVTSGFFRTEMRWHTDRPSRCAVSLTREGEADRELAASEGHTHIVTFLDMEPGGIYRVQILADGQAAAPPVVIEAPGVPRIDRVTASPAPDGTLLTFRTPVPCRAEATWKEGSAEGVSSREPDAAEEHRLLLKGFRPQGGFDVSVRCVSRLEEVWTSPMLQAGGD